ncbi:Protein of unknown function DUF1999 [Marinithermus hydrothermalis DSM 14884]|uniref:N-acetyltransferase domain-containing protein n=2 Tax=Marinithermus TaxID=186191 RepID=F2NMB4_MARHT|nr:Protein of unknown function DUF1999 [Marinithermus hydrothermalis DSM 14884]
MQGGVARKLKGMEYRPFDEQDFPAMEAFERALLEGAPEHAYRAHPAALRFFMRTGHSFVASTRDAVHGFALAQAVWQGDRPTVFVTRILAADGAAYEGLLRAVVKSAYDAGVYEVAMHIDPEHEALVAAAQAAGFTLGPLVLATRVLGSRGVRGETRHVLE